MSEITREQGARLSAVLRQTILCIPSAHTRLANFELACSMFSRMVDMFTGALCANVGEDRCIEIIQVIVKEEARDWEQNRKQVTLI